MSKTLRQFQCRDDLWARVEALAKRKGIPADDVVQAALLQLFKAGKGKKDEPSGMMAAAGPNTPPRPVTPVAPGATPRPAAAPVSPPTLPRPPTQSRLPPPTSAPASKPKPLYVWFENEWYEIDKEEFVIGRGAKFSDLAIKDANISRRHCSVVRRGHDYFIKDLGSTNGIEFEGQRVDNHKIIDGSVYFLCDHEIRFTFTPPNRT